MRLEVTPKLPVYRDHTWDKIQIPAAPLLGMLVSLYAPHQQYEAMSVNHWLQRVMPFINKQTNKLFLTQGGSPYGFAAWIELNNDQHKQMLTDATWERLQSVLLEGNNDASHLWFVDLITPFSNSLTVVENLKTQLTNHSMAWALNVNPNKAITRRVW